jgi:hypothetical protein
MFRGNQKEDDRGRLCIQTSLCIHGYTYEQPYTVLKMIQNVVLYCR